MYTKLKLLLCGVKPVIGKTYLTVYFDRELWKSGNIS
jgi:hypothetical protein